MEVAGRTDFFSPFAKDTNFMRISRSQCALVLILTIGISGCYSGGKWSMPNLAFWKSNPFSSSSTATAGTYPPAATGPAKPSALASNNSSGATTTALSYQGAATTTTPGSAAAPQYSYTPTATSPAAPATVPNYYSGTPNNSAASPAYTASLRNSVTAGTSLTPQQGLYGSTGYTDAITGRQQTPFVSTGAAPASTSIFSANSYPATAANNRYSNSSYSNPVRPPIPPSTNPTGQATTVTVPPAAIVTAVPATDTAAFPTGTPAPTGILSRPAARVMAWRDRYAPTGNASTLPASSTSYGASRIDTLQPATLQPAALRPCPRPRQATAQVADRYSRPAVLRPAALRLCPRPRQATATAFRA